MSTASSPLPLSATATRTVLAPLTTVFTPAASCNSYMANGALAVTETYWQGQACSGGKPVDTPSCWPPALVQETSTPFHGRGFYSPGISCPAGYSSACTAALNTDGSPSSLALGTSFVFEFPLTAGETAIGCCPLGLTCGYSQGAGQTCVSIVTSTQLPNLVFCDDSSKIRTTQSIHVPEAFVGSDNTTITIKTASLYGPLVQINFKNTDISSLPPPISTTTSTSSSQGAAASTTSGGAYGTSQTATPDQDQSGGLSSGAKIGIGVGVPLGVLALAAIVFFLLWRRRQMRTRPMGYEQPRADPSKGPLPIDQGPIGQTGYDTAYDPTKYNTHAAPFGGYGTRENIELDGTSPRQELLGSDAPRAELPEAGYGRR